MTDLGLSHCKEILACAYSTPVSIKLNLLSRVDSPRCEALSVTEMIDWTGRSPRVA